jgi:hypothetical protein
MILYSILYAIACVGITLGVIGSIVNLFDAV